MAYRPLPSNTPAFEMPPALPAVPNDSGKEQSEYETAPQAFTITVGTANAWTAEYQGAALRLPHDACDVYFSQTSIGSASSANALNIALSLYAVSNGVRALVGRGALYVDPQLASYGLPLPIRYMTGARRGVAAYYEVGISLMTPSPATFSGIITAVGYGGGGGEPLMNARVRDTDFGWTTGTTKGRVSQSYAWNRPCWIHRIKGISDVTTAASQYLHIFYKSGRSIPTFTPGTALANGTIPDDVFRIPANGDFNFDFGANPLVCDQAFFWQLSSTRDTMTLAADALATSALVTVEYA